MKTFLFVTDLHGSRARYERTLALAVETGAAFVVNGGDMMPHGRTEGAQASFIREFLDPHFAACEAAGIGYLTITGNDDLSANDGLLEEVIARHPLVENLDGRAVPVGPYDFIGLNRVTDFPFRLKDRARRDGPGFVFPPQSGAALFSIPGGFKEIGDWPAHAGRLPTIEEELWGLPAPRDPARAVYVLHGPPAGLGLDVCRGKAPVGSAATRRFIEARQPLLTLHGHIHESPEESGVWMARHGRTVCIQPGQAATGLTVVVVDLDSMTFERRVVPL
jgi:Icc-related predicted phosphoesterase